MSGLIIVAGPTASGKSALALRLAEALAGVVINADSMQLYRELRIVTARPSPADEARVPHRLYGVLAADQPSSAGRWLELVRGALDEARADGRVAIVVGGTGLYLHALIHGLAPVPEVPQAVRVGVRARFAELGGAAFHAELAEHDPLMVARLHPSDRQRLMRAREVLEATGRSLADWQRLPPRRVALPTPWLGFALMPPRAALYDRIARRLHGMIEGGALAELATFGRRGLASDLSLMKALAVPELLAHLDGRLERTEALARAITRTRRYAKRQLTWLRHRLPELKPLEAFGDAPEALPDVARLRALLLTKAAFTHTVRPAP